MTPSWTDLFEQNCRRERWPTHRATAFDCGLFITDRGLEEAPRRMAIFEHRRRHIPGRYGQAHSSLRGFHWHGPQEKTI